MSTTRGIILAGLAFFAALAAAHHGEAPGRGASAMEARGAGPDAGPRAFISVFDGGSFQLPSAP